WDKFRRKFTNRNVQNFAAGDSELEKFLTKILGFRPVKLDIYKRAFVHRSAQVKDENGNDVNFERLEFLGDAVLGLIISVFIFEELAGKQEGCLSKMRSKLVSRSQLDGVGRQMQHAKRLQAAGNPNLGEDINGDVGEALIGALYLDKGFDTTAK